MQNSYRGGMKEISLAGDHGGSVSLSVGGDIFFVDVDPSGDLPQGPCRMQCLLFALCVEGGASYAVDSEERTVGPGDMMVFSVGQVARFCSMDDGCRITGIMVSYDFFNDVVKDVRELSSLFLFARRYPVYKLTPGEADAVLEYVAMMKRVASTPGHRFVRDAIRSIFAAMVYDVSNAIYRVVDAEDSKRRADKIFTDFMRLVEQNFRQQRRVGWYAERMGLSAKYLSEMVKQVSRRTSNEWIDYYVMRELKAMLKDTSMSIKDITDEMNFANQSFLGKYFKEHAGVSPSKFRKA